MHIEDYFETVAQDDIRIKGTRLGIESVLFEYLHREQTPESIARRYPTLTLEQVYATILYYLQHRSDLHAYMTEWLKHGMEMRKAQAENPPPVVARLKALKHVAASSGPRSRFNGQFQ